MTFQAYIMIRQLKTVQMQENGTIWIDEDNRQMMTVTESNQSGISIDLSKKWNSIFPMFQYLQEMHLLEKKSRFHYSLTYSGYHYTQTIISSFFSFLIKSILVPIGVSAFTTIVILMIEHWLV